MKRACLLLLVLGLLPLSSHAQNPDPLRIRNAMVKTNWTAQWIGPAQVQLDALPAASTYPEKHPRAKDPLANSWIACRKTFELANVPTTVPAQIAVDSKYWLWVNGRLVVFEGQLKRGPTPQDTYFDEIDLAPYLQEGKNTLAILVWYFGKTAFSHVSSGKPGLLFEANLGEQTLVSDASWKVQIHPAYLDRSQEGEQPNFRLSESNVIFDAQKDTLEGWTRPEYSDSAWPNAAEFGKAPVAPWNALWKRPTPLFKDYGLLSYVNDSELPKEGTGEVIEARLPYNCHITPYLDIEAPAGLTIGIQTDHYKGGVEPNVRAEYITRAGRQTYESLGWMNGHKVLYTIPKGVKILALKFRETGYNTAFTGAFECNDPFYNTLWQKARRTLYITMRDTYMDCPDRERSQWWGDAVNELGEAFYSLDVKSHLITRKGIVELVNWQRENKTIFSPMPGNYNTELPLQMLASVGYYGFWTYYLNTGDAEPIWYAYPKVKDYLNVWKLDAEGLVIPRKGEWDWGDWGENIDMKMLASEWYYLALKGAINMANLSGHPEDVAVYEKQMDTIRKAFEAKFWTGSEYRDPDYKGKTDDRANSMAVVAGLAGPDKWDKIKTVLATQYHASPYMEKYVEEALFLMHDAKAAQERMKKRFTGMVQIPLTTLPEMWEGGTNNHAWTGGPLTLLSQYAVGVAPREAAYKTFQVLPQMGELTTAKARVDSVAGPIDVTLKRDEKTFNLDLTVPANTTAIVGIPKDTLSKIARIEANGQTVWKNGVSADPLKDLKFESEDTHYVLFRVTSGKWAFAAFVE
jgi:hypothetical protein